MILAHPLILLLEHPARAELLNPLGGNWASRCAWVSVFSLLAIVVTSMFRKRLKLPYEWWRLSHLILGVIAIIFAQLHVSMAGLYTNTLWKQAVWIGIALAMVGLVVYLRLIKPAWQRAYTWRVAEIRPELGDTYTLALEPVGHPGIRFQPGQFAWIKLAGSPYTLEEHPFSISSSAQRSDRLEFGIKALGDFTRTVKDIPVGTAAYVDGPHGAFSIDRYPATGYVFIGGGVGITPFMSFLHTLADRQDPRPITLLYGAKSESDMAYQQTLERLAERLTLRIIYVLEEPSDAWQGERGFIDKGVLERHLTPEDYRRIHFVCGPPAMIAAVEKALREHGVSEEDILTERFDLV